MADYREIPEQIRAFLAASDATGQRGWTPETAELAEAYASLIRDANERLRRCAEYLRRGMRSEAVHLAECQPELTELAESLRLPDPLRWSRACVTHGLPAPPELLADGIDQLQAAVPAERELAPLLARHRLLALAPAPIKDRLEVLRALHDRDPACSAWEQGLQQLETAHFKEIRAAARVAFKNRDLPTIERLSEELHVAHTPPPDDLLDGMDKALNSLRLEEARKSLMPVLEAFESAYRARDLAAGTRLLEQWQTLIDQSHVVLPPDLQARVRPAAAWLAKEDKRRQTTEKLAALQPALASGQKDVKSWLRATFIQMTLIAIGAAVLIGLIVLLAAHVIQKH